jgi:hypothetical protein
MVIEYTLEVDDVAAARLLAIGIRPRLEFALFAVAIALLLAWSVSPWSVGASPLLIGLTASLGAFRLTQIARLKEAARAAYQRNPTLRQLTSAAWDDRGITIAPAGSPTERILWTDLRPLRENDRVVLLLQPGGSLHAVPKRAFSNRATLEAFRLVARRFASKE